jgi:hypothetical protein
MTALEWLADTLRVEGGLLADALAPRPQGPSGPGARAALGPRAVGREQEYELLLEAIYEGYLLHYGRARVIAASDPDLALLVGDRLYALGLARLVELGDLEAVTELADVISLTAVAEAAGDAELAQAVWEAGATAVGWGGRPEHEAAKAAVRRGEAGAAAALAAVARSGG